MHSAPICTLYSYGYFLFGAETEQPENYPAFVNEISLHSHSHLYILLKY